MDEIALHIVRREGVNDMLPGVTYFHGTGWLPGNKETHVRLVCEIVNGVHAAMVFVEYACSTEVKYPIAIGQVYAATRWAAEYGATIGVETPRLAVARDNVEGSLVVAIHYLQRNEEVHPWKARLNLRMHAPQGKVVIQMFCNTTCHARQMDTILVSTWHRHLVT